MNYEKKYLKYKKKYLSIKDTFISKGFDTSIESNYKNKYCALKHNINSSKQIIDNINNLNYKNKHLMKGSGLASGVNLSYEITKCTNITAEIPCEIPIKKLNIDENFWKPISKMESQGAYGEVYLGYLIDQEDPKKIDETNVKIIKFIKLHAMPYATLEDKTQHIKDEICLQNIAASLKIGPMIEDYWLCEDLETAVIIMEKAGELSLNDLMEQTDAYLNNDEIDNESKIKMLFELYMAYKLAIAKIMKLNHNYIIHNDFHLDNIYIKTGRKEVNGAIVNHIVDVKLIDYGLSKRLNTISINAEEYIARNNSELTFMNNIKLFKDNNKLSIRDYEEFLNNGTNGIRSKIDFFEKEERNNYIQLLKQFCNTLNINSIYYYYTLMLIKDEINQNIESSYNYTTKDDINEFIKTMFNTDGHLGLFIGSINEKIVSDINYIFAFEGHFNHTIDEIKDTINEFEDIINIKDLRSNVMPSIREILAIETKN